MKDPSLIQLCLTGINFIYGYSLVDIFQFILLQWNENIIHLLYLGAVQVVYCNLFAIGLYTYRAFRSDTPRELYSREGWR